VSTLLNPTLARLLVTTGMALSGVAAHAASGYSVNPVDEQRVSVGMTQADVLQALGKPAIKQRFANEPGPTWSYSLPGDLTHQTLFDVDFSANGRVLSIGERFVYEE
jgi:outer membrane protein assembly factor BamE (lipoprotein component of BamABCDE complex)